MGQRRWIKLFSDYDCEIGYHLGKANVVANALSIKERVKPRRVRAMPMTIQSSIKDKFLAAQYEASKEENTAAEMLHGLDQQMEKKEDGGLYFMDRIWVPLIGDVRTMIMDEAHVTRDSIHPRSDKLYYDLSDMYWWPGMKRDIATYVIVDRLTKSAHFLATPKDYSMEKLSRLYIDEIMARHGKALGTRLDMSTAYHPQTDGQSKLIIQTLKDILRAVTLERCSAFGKKYMLALSVLDVFHASNLKRCLADANLHMPLEGIKADKHSSFCEEPVEIIDCEMGTPTHDGSEGYAYSGWNEGIRLSHIYVVHSSKGEPSEANEVNLRG
ncbi:putative reverse transcriptase domain-containing protein [Tanacetum coccineum]